MGELAQKKQVLGVSEGEGLAGQTLRWEKGSRELRVEESEW